MKTLEQAQNEKSDACASLAAANCLCDTDPEVLEARRVYQAVVEKKREFYSNIRKQAYDRYLKSCEELNAVQEELRRLEEKKRLKIPESVRDAVKELSRGVDWGPQGLVIHWYSESGRFAILKQPGHRYWNGIGSSAYGLTKYKLIDVARQRSNDTMKGMLVKEFEGRFGKKQMEECEKIIEDIKAEKS